MKIRLVRTGGFAGLRREVTVDTDDLGPERAVELGRLLESARRAGVFELSRRKDKGRDRFLYHLTVEDEHGRREAMFSEESGPESAILLVESVWRASEPASPSGVPGV